MDEYLKTINIWAISSYNISAYVRKTGKYACVIDAMALVMDRESYTLFNTLKYMLETYPCNHSQISFSNNPQNKDIAMMVDDLIPFLCKIPGRECRYRLYRYAEPLLKYLEGDQFLLQQIINAKDSEDQRILNSVKRKINHHEDFKSKIAKLRDFEMYVYESTYFPSDWKPSDAFLREIDKIRNDFYSRGDNKLDIEEINEKRKDEVESFMYIEEASKLKKTDEISFGQVIQDLGYEDDFFKRLKCYEYGSDMKEKKGHKKICKKGRQCGYIYTDEDIEEMRKIVKNVYEEF